MPSALLALALVLPHAHGGEVQEPTTQQTLGPWQRPAIAEAQRTHWVDWLLQDGDRRFQQGRMLAAIGTGAVFLGAGLSLGDVFQDGLQRDAMRPGAIVALAGAPFLLSGLPTMAAGAGRMHKALRMEGLAVTSVPIIGAWSMLGTGALLLPLSTLIWSIPPSALLFAGGIMGAATYGLATAQYKVNQQVEFPRPWVLPAPIRQGAMLTLNARW